MPGVVQHHRFYSQNNFPFTIPLWYQILSSVGFCQALHHFITGKSTSFPSLPALFELLTSHVTFTDFMLMTSQIAAFVIRTFI